MKTHFRKYIVLAILVISITVGAFSLLTPSDLTGQSNSVGAEANLGVKHSQELDLGQMDEQAKLGNAALFFPAANGELDLGQMDEQAKLGNTSLFFPAANGELDLGQLDEMAKLGH